MSYRETLNEEKRIAKLVLATVERAGLNGECGDCQWCIGDFETTEEWKKAGSPTECPKWKELKIKILNRYSYDDYKGDGGVSISSTALRERKREQKWVRRHWDSKKKRWKKRKDCNCSYCL